jgi:hypothetical protein
MVINCCQSDAVRKIFCRIVAVFDWANSAAFSAVIETMDLSSIQDTHFRFRDTAGRAA